MTDLQKLRLELIALVHVPGMHIDVTLDEVAEALRFVLGDAPEPTAKFPGVWKDQVQ